MSFNSCSSVLCTVVHMLILCFHAQTIMKCAVTCRCPLILPTTHPSWFSDLKVPTSPLTSKFRAKCNVPFDLFACCFSCVLSYSTCCHFSLTRTPHVVRASVHAGYPAELRDSGHVSSLWGHRLRLWEVQDPGGKTFCDSLCTHSKKEKSKHKLIAVIVCKTTLKTVEVCS